MTTPNIVPSAAKAWVALAGSLLTIIGPWILSASSVLPQPWPGIVGLVFAGLTAAGVYQAPYRPKGTVIVPDPGTPDIWPRPGQ